MSQKFWKYWTCSTYTVDHGPLNCVVAYQRISNHSDLNVILVSGLGAFLPCPAHRSGSTCSTVIQHVCVCFRTITGDRNRILPLYAGKTVPTPLPFLLPPSISFKIWRTLLFFYLPHFQISLQLKGLSSEMEGGIKLVSIDRSPFKGTGTRDLIWLKVVSLDRSWLVGLTDDI